MPYFDSIIKSYYNILIIDTLPNDLSSYAKRIHPPSLTNHFGSNRIRLDCIHAFISMKNQTQLMNIDELPQLFTILMEQGYNINTKITNMILKTGVLPEGKKVIAYISK
jgi:CMP-2-keto-3-deoxyoctulosonic acid synthetase